MAYTVCRLDNMAGTQNATKLRSAKFFVGSTATEIENGRVVKLDGLVNGERDLHKAVAPDKAATIGQIGLVATPEIMYDERKRNLDDFINPAGDAIRVYVLTSNDQFSITVDGVTGSPAVGQVIELDGTTKLKAVASATAGSTTVGKVIAIEKVGTKNFCVIEVA